jgi:hypothetical protein
MVWVSNIWIFYGCYSAHKDQKSALCAEFSSKNVLVQLQLVKNCDADHQINKNSGFIEKLGIVTAGGRHGWV